MAIDHSADHFGERHGLPLGLAGDIAHSIDQRHIGRVKIIGSSQHGGIERADTHFFQYGPQIDPPPYVVLLERFPMLRAAATTSLTGTTCATVMGGGPSSIGGLSRHSRGTMT